MNDLPTVTLGILWSSEGWGLAGPGFGVGGVAGVDSCVAGSVAAVVGHC